MEREIGVKYKLNWLHIIPLIVLISFISTIWAGFQDPTSGHLFTLQFYSHFLQFPAAGLILVPIITLLLPPRLRTKISNANIALATIAVFITLSVTSGVYFPWKVVEGFWQARLSTAYNHNILTADFFAPPESVMIQIRNNVFVPWSELMPSMINWIVFPIIWYFYMISFNNILRRRWIDVEELPYPYSSTTISIIESGSMEAESPKKKKYVMSGLILGIVVYLPYILGTYFAWFPKLYGWGTTPFLPGERYAILDDVVAFPGWSGAVVGCTGINTEPLVYALLYLIPISTLLTMVVFWLIFIMILPQILYNLGSYSGIMSQAALARRDTFALQPPLKLEAFSSLGLLPGIIVFNLLLNWRYLAETFRMAFGKMSDEHRKIEANEPLSYRQTYLMLIASTLAVLIWLFTAGLGSAAALMVLLFTFIDTMAWNRVVGLAGPAPSGWSHGCGYFKWLWPNITTESQVTREFAMTMTMVGKGPLASVYVSPPQFAAFNSMTSYKIGREMGIRNRDIFNVMTIAVILGSIVSVVTMHVVVQTWGWMRLPVTKESDYLAQGTLSFINPRPSAEPWWQWSLAGFILCGVMSYMRAKYVWFPLDPVGAVIITQRNGFGAGIAYPTLIAFIAKYITLKVYGSKFYENSAVPFVSGFIGGQVIMAIVGGLLATIRFFVPL